MTTQQNSPGNTNKSSEKYWTIAVWVVYGLVLSLLSEHWLIGVIGALCFAVASFFVLYDFRSDSQRIQWKPWLVTYAGSLGISMGTLLFDSGSQCIIWSIVFLIMLRALYSESDSQKNRKAKDVI